MPSEVFADPAGSERWSGIWPGLLVAAIAVVVYLPAFAAGFNADDYLILGRIKSIEGSGRRSATSSSRSTSTSGR